jgi:hypothetical protein
MGSVSPDEPSKLISGQPVLLNDAKEVAKFILENDPSIEDINEISRRLTEARTIEQLEKYFLRMAMHAHIKTQERMGP